MSRFDADERALDRVALAHENLLQAKPLVFSNPDLEPIQDDESPEFITKEQFDRIIGGFYQSLLIVNKNNALLLKENKEIRDEISYFKSIVMKQFLETTNKKSQENSSNIRKIFGLPQINEKADALIINELDGILDDISDENESSVEILKKVRGV